MPSSLTIGQLAKKAGVPVSTVRYYERADLLRADGRSEGNYRLYSPQALDRLRFIRASKAVGFTLDDITQLLDVQDGVVTPCEEVQHLIEHRLEELEHHLADLKRVKSILASLRTLCRKTPDKEHCDVLDQLSASKAAE